MSFALWSLASAAPNVAAVVGAEGDFSGTLLCMVADTAAEVGSTLGAVEDAGGRVVVADHEVAFGRSGWFLDPVGTTWEVAWIDGRDSAAPFPGTALVDAMPAALVGATLGTDDPAGLEKFYADGLGWAGRRCQCSGRLALALDGGTLAFAQTSGRSPSVPVPMVRPHGGATVDDVVEHLVREGATRVPRLDAPAGESPDAGVVDPFGLHWEVVAGN